MPVAASETFPATGSGTITGIPGDLPLAILTAALGRGWASGAAVVREPHDVIKLPLERSKFGRGAEFASDWIDNGSMKFSPIAQEMKQLHIDAAHAREGMTER